MKKKIIGLSIVIILIGIIMVFVKGFKVNLKYRDHKMVKLSIGQECNIKEFNKIAIYKYESGAKVNKEWQHWGATATPRPKRWGKKQLLEFGT